MHLYFDSKTTSSNRELIGQICNLQAYIPGTVKFISRGFFLSGFSAEPVNEKLKIMYHDMKTTEENTKIHFKITNEF